MGAPRTRKPLIKSRRRVADEGEEEDGSVATGAEEDSLSEGSVISDADDDADGEGSDGSGSDSPVERSSEAAPVANGHSRPAAASSQGKAGPPTAMNDTIVMMNGLDIGDVPEGPELHFDDLAQKSLVPEAKAERNALMTQISTSSPGRNASTPQKPNLQVGSLSQKSTPGPEASALMSQDEGGEALTSHVGKARREHEEYKRKRDGDPAFVPNRGGFFMHDHRSVAAGQNGFRPFGRGRGRVRGGPTSSSFGYVLP